MSQSIRRGRAVGLAAGYLADVLWADPRRGHPVAAFGTAAMSLERLTYSDRRVAGVAHTGILLGGLGVLGVVAERIAARRGPGWTAAVTAAATFVVLGGTSLGRTGADMARRLEDGDLESARQLVPSLCGRDPNSLDEAGIARATVESVAENTADAQVAPLWWGAIGGVPGLLVYRGANTLDAMIGHKSPRLLQFGWAAARFDDVANYLPARATGFLTVVCAPVVSGSPRGGAGRLASGRRAPPEPQRGGGRGVVRRCARRATGRTDAIRPPPGDQADVGGGPRAGHRRCHAIGAVVARRSARRCGRGGGAHCRLP